jgi:hypothetical protein
MKLFTTVAFGIMMFGLHANATTYTLSNGNFGNQTSSLSLADGDVIEIPAGSNVTFTTSQTISEDVTLNVKGTFNMTPGNKILTLSCGGVANVYPGGTVSGSDASQKIIICGNYVYYGNTTVTTSTSTLTATSSSSGFMTMSPLPLKFISFDAAVKPSGVSLSWTAVNDGPANSFTVQQSPDGKSWNDLSVVMARGTDHETVSYTYDVAAARTGTAIYRVRYTGTNETEVVYSASRLVNFGGASRQTTAAIGADAGRIQIGLSAEEGRGATTVIVSAMDGRVIYTGEYAADKSSFSIPVSVTGIVAVTITDGTSFKIARKVAIL